LLYTTHNYQEKNKFYKDCDNITTMITARSQVKDILKEEDMRNMSNDFMERLDQEVDKLIKNAVKRAKENLRKTVMGRDL